MEEISEATLWEAHKAYVRGILIQLGTERKKAGIRRKNALIKDITRIEQKHKKTGNVESLATLICKREELKELVEQDTRSAYNKVKKERYLWENKIGKPLARMLKKISVNYIEKIQDSTGTMVYTTSGIAKIFQEYYAKLYAINKTSEQKNKRKDKTRVFF